jgi:hypothetical protein
MHLHVDARESVLFNSLTHHVSYGVAWCTYTMCMFALSQDGFECNDLYEFNFLNRQWRKVKTKGVIPKDRYLPLFVLVFCSVCSQSLCLTTT